MEKQKSSKADSQRARAYQERVSRTMPKSKTLMQCVNAFLIGGLICCVGQVVKNIGLNVLSLSETDVAAFVSVVMIFLGATLTGLGVYDKIGRVAGAGSVVPITGFANSIVSPAMEFKREGYVLGVGAKLFSIAGPVLVYGILASIAVGLIALLLK